MGRQQAESRRVTSKVAQKCCKSKKSVFWHPQRHASSRNIKTFVLPHKTGHLRVDSSHIWTQLGGGLSPIVEMVMGETQSHVSRLGRLRKAPESGQSGPTIDLCEFLGSSLSLEHSTNLSDGVYRHRAPEYPDKSHLGPDWPLSGALRSLPRFSFVPEPGARNFACGANYLAPGRFKFCLRRKLPAPGTKGGLFCICVESRNLT